MNATRLREIVDLLLTLEAEFQTQARLNDASSHLSSIVQQPQEPQFQTQFSSDISQLRQAAEQTRERLQPAQISLIEEIGGKPFFVDDIAAFINGWVSQNAVTPAVAQQKIQQLLNGRQTYIDQITQLRDSLKAVGIEAVSLKEGEAEIGFLSHAV